MFAMNGRRWCVRHVDSRHPLLIDRTGRRCLATTDPDSMTVWLDSSLSGAMLDRVLIHELGHCVMISYGLTDELRRMVRPECLVEAEEWVCNFIADYGNLVFDSARAVLGRRAIAYVPGAMESLVA